MRIAFLGLGKMGQLMAGHLISAGHDLAVWNRSAGKAGELVARGAREYPSAADATRGADAVVLMLFDAPAVRSVLDSCDLAAGTLVIDASTTGPTEALAISAQLAGSGVRYVDAPVTGSTPVAAKGALGVLLGGSDPDVEVARTVVSAWGDPEKIRHVGAVGAGQAMKVVMNLSLGLAIQGVGECLALASTLELDLTMTLDVLGGGPFGFTLAQKREMIAARDFSSPTFTVDALAKDMHLAAGLGADGQATTGALTSASKAQDDGQGGDDYSAIALSV